ncbi:hypothetical protein ABZ464_49180 [Streptomyces sp. NPDC005820]|uniref:hypothetical protein n=1 Tax=Streptomyces sp. NPDC005820 TaxID=3157069 RepID=UPI0033FD7629
MRVMIRYKLKPDQVERNLKLLSAAYEEMNALRPPGLKHVSYQLDDKVTFVDFVETEGRGAGPLATLPAFGLFRATLDARCVEPPRLIELHDAGSYDGFA